MALCKGLVGSNGDAAGVEDHGVARNAGLLMIGPGQASVDDKESAAGPVGKLSLLFPDRHMAVYDMPQFGGDPEFRKDLLHDLRLIAELIIGVHVLLLKPGIIRKIPLEGGDPGFSEEGRTLSAPEVPQQIHRLCPVCRLLRIVPMEEVGVPDLLIEVIHKGPAGIGFSLDVDLIEAAVSAQGDTAVEQEVPVDDLVELSVGKEEAQMLFQQLAVPEGGGEGVHQLLLGRGQAVGILWVHRGEVPVRKRDTAASHGDGAGGIVDALQQKPVLHVVFRVPHDQLPLQLELDDGDGLVHAGCQLRRHGVIFILIQQMGLEAAAGIRAVGLLGKHGQGAQVDAVAVLKKIEVIVAQGDAHHIADAGLVAAEGSDPAYVMIAPFHIHVLVFPQLLHHQVRMGTPVEDVSDDMEGIDGKAVDQVAEGRDEALSGADPYDGVYDGTVIGLLVVLRLIHLEKLLYDVDIGLGDLLADLGAGIFGGYVTAEADEPVDGEPLPLRKALRVLPFQKFPLRLFQLPLGVVDEGGQFGLLLFRHGLGKQLPDLGADDTGGGAEQMDKGLVFSVDVTEKILRPLWQLQDRAEIDDLRNGGLPVGKFPGKQSEIGGVFHRNSFLCKMVRLLLPPSYNERRRLRTGSGKASEKNKNL